MPALDKDVDSCQEKLRLAREDTWAARDGYATDEEARRAALQGQTYQEYFDIAAFCRVNDTIDPGY